MTRMWRFHRVSVRRGAIEVRLFARRFELRRSLHRGNNHKASDFLYFLVSLAAEAHSKYALWVTRQKGRGINLEP